MTYTEMRNWFLILQDKYGSPYYTDSEITQFLNRAQIDEVLGLLPIDGGDPSIELNQNVVSRIYPLLFIFSPINMSISGYIRRQDIETVIDRKIMRILSMSYNGFPVKWTRHNNWFVYLNNIFKVPIATEPRFLEDHDNLLVRPIDITATISVSGVCYPLTLLSDGSINSNLPEIMHNEVVARALSYAGVGSRDQLLSELKQQNAV